MRHIREGLRSDESTTGSRRNVLRAFAGIGAAAVGSPLLAGEAAARDRDCPPPVRFVRIYGGEGAERVYSVVETPDGGFLLGGETEPCSDVTSPTDALVVKVDAVGDVAWTNEYGGAGRFDAVRSVVPTADGGYGLVGNTGSFDSSESDAWLFEIDSDGDVRWSETYGGSGGDGVQSGVRTADGGYALAGQTSSPELASDEIDEDDEYGDVWLVKTDGDGSREFARAYSTQRRASEGARAVVQTVDGGYAFVGRKTTLEGNLDPNDDVDPTSTTDARLVKTDATGDVEWTDTYDGNGADWPYSLVQTANGGYAFAGKTDGFETDDPARLDDVLLVAVGGDGGS